jgi:hypothetical protein
MNKPAGEPNRQFLKEVQMAKTHKEMVNFPGHQGNNRCKQH